MRKQIERIVDELAEDISSLESGEPTFGDERYNPYPIEGKNFHKIPDTNSSRKISFIDGGNQSLISTPTFSIHLIRVYFNIFEGNKRINPSMMPSKLDFYSVSMARGEDKIKYVTKTVPADEISRKYLPISEGLVFNSWDKSLQNGNFRVDIDDLGGVTRKFAEWYVSGLISEQELGENDMIVHDGNLQSTVSHESKFAQKAFEKAEKNGVIFSGLAKSTRVYTTTGNTLVGVIKKLGEEELPEESWYYYPVADIERQDHPAEMYFVKLHPESDYVFRYEILKKQAERKNEEEIEEIIGELSQNSHDPSFPGYPYGLMDADRFGRVRNEEKKTHENMLKSAFSGKDCWADLREYLMATDAHSVLDRIQGGKS